jgi:DNA-binding transcriptional MerR regulator
MTNNSEHKKSKKVDIRKIPESKVDNVISEITKRANAIQSAKDRKARENYETYRVALDPYKETIVELRTKGWSVKAIHELLTESVVLKQGEGESSVEYTLTLKYHRLQRYIRELEEKETN